MARHVRLLSPHPPREIFLRLRACTRTPVRFFFEWPGMERAQFVGTVEDDRFRLRPDNGNVSAIRVHGTCTAQDSGTHVDLVFKTNVSLVGLLLSGFAIALFVRWPELRTATDVWAAAAALAVPAGIVLLGSIAMTVVATHQERAFARELRERLDAVVVPRDASSASDHGR